MDGKVLPEHEEAGKGQTFLAVGPVLAPATELGEKLIVIQGQPRVLALGRAQSLAILRKAR